MRKIMKRIAWINAYQKDLEMGEFTMSTYQCVEYRARQDACIESLPFWLKWIYRYRRSDANR